MVQKFFAQWIQKSQVLENDKPPQVWPHVVSTPVKSWDYSANLHQWILLPFVVLCFLLLITSIVLGVLYNRASRDDSLQQEQLKLEIRNLTDYNTQLQGDNRNLTDYNTQLQGDNRNLTDYNTKLKGDNRNLTDYNTQLQAEIRHLTDYNTQLQAEIRKLTYRIKHLQAEIMKLTYRIKHLQAEIRNPTDYNREFTSEEGSTPETWSFISFPFSMD